jgi:hypothetical protein
VRSDSRRINSESCRAWIHDDPDDEVGEIIVRDGHVAVVSDVTPEAAPTLYLPDRRRGGYALKKIEKHTPRLGFIP